MRTERQWCIRYVPKELNQYIDCLAKLSLAGKARLQIFFDDLNEVLEFLQQDKANDAFAQLNLMYFCFLVYDPQK